ncbi:MAG: DUF1800 domain-containing protein [Bacteroidota bacterium]
MNCAVSNIDPYIPDATMPWNKERAVHLYRRMAFGTDVETVQQALQGNPQTIVDALVEEALNLPLSPEPEWSEKVKSEYGLALLESVLQKDGWARQWIKELQQNGLRGRMALFWHNHFVTRFDIYESSSYMYKYHKLLQQHALGNFKDFVYDIGLTPAMLVFLNGNQNTLGIPNENYAREVYELFTLGVDNGYTQQDIVETARAFTGYTDMPEEWGPISFDPNTHDAGVKTIFGQTGNWNYDDVIRILFEERANEIATFIAAKLYCNFVNPTVDEDMVQELATIFIDSNWSIAALMRALFKSTHFYDTKNMGTIIEGHLEMILLFFNEINVDISDLSVLGIYGDTTKQGQALFNPVDVAGWPGNRSWINTTSIAYRWEYFESQLGILLLFGFGSLGDMVRTITTEESDVELVCRDLVHYYLPRGLQFDSDYEDALISFKGEIPENYFQDGTWNVNYWALPLQLYGLLKYLIRMPEYQLK